MSASNIPEYGELKVSEAAAALDVDQVSNEAATAPPLQDGFCPRLAIMSLTNSSITHTVDFIITCNVSDIHPKEISSKGYQLDVET